MGRGAEIVKRLKMFLKDDEAINCYINNYGYDLNMANIKKINSDNTAIITEDKNPLYRLKLSCPLCKTELTGFDIKAKSMLIKYDWFFNPYYTAVNDFKNFDFSLYMVSVCPKCLFASPDRKDFRQFNSYLQTYSEPQTKSELIPQYNKSYSKRLEIIDFKESNKNLFEKFPRPLDLAIMGYRLAVFKGESEILFNLTNSHFKTGNYLLRVAKFKRIKGESENKIKEILGSALELFLRAFKLANFTKKEYEYFNLYLIITLFIFLEEENKALEYANFGRKLDAELVTEEDHAAGAKWKKRIADVLENRKEKEKFAYPKEW